MCGKNFRNIDYKDWKIIMFVVRRKSFFETLPNRACRLYLLLDWDFYTTHGYCFWHLHLVSCKLHTYRILEVEEEFCTYCMSCLKNLGQHNFWFGHPIRKKIIFPLKGYMFTPWAKIWRTFIKKWLYMHLPKITCVCSIVIWSFRG